MDSICGNCGTLLTMYNTDAVTGGHVHGNCAQHLLNQRNDALERIRQLEAAQIDNQVREFHEVMGIENRKELGVPSDDVVRLHLRLVAEEFFEFLSAHFDVTAIIPNTAMAYVQTAIVTTRLKVDLVEVADALADLDYVVAGTRLAYGIPQAPVAAEVHASNMRKAPGGVVLRDERGKVKKPEGWVGPDIRKALGLGPTKRAKGGTP